MTETRAAVERLDGPLARLETTALGTRDIVEKIQETATGLESSSSRVEEFHLKTYTIAKHLEAESYNLREQTETMKLFSREIADQAHNGYPALRQALVHDMEQAISAGLRQVQRDLRECLAESGGTSFQGAARRPGGGDHRLFERDISSSPHTQDHYVSPTQALPKFQSQYARAADTWTRNPAAVTWRRVINIAPFGTIIVQITTASYVKRRPGVSNAGPEMATKEESQTTITFLPATWLSLSGAKFQYGAVTHPAPPWSLQGVNVIPDDSDIFLCCKTLDLDGIRNLFDAKHASPFDVDNEGRNLLGYLGLGARVSRLHQLCQATYLT